MENRVGKTVDSSLFYISVILISLLVSLDKFAAITLGISFDRKCVVLHNIHVQASALEQSRLAV